MLVIGRVGSEEVFRPPHPLRAALLAPPSALAPAALWASGAVSAVAAAAAGGALVAMTAVRAGYVGFDAWRCRRLADRLLRTQRRAALASSLVAWRADELTSRRTRRRLAKWVRDLTVETELCLEQPPPAVAATIEQSLVLLRELEARLADFAQPVSARGMLVVRELVVEGDLSPLYWPERAAYLPRSLCAALDSLDSDR
jgi:hypothetical protein